MSDMNNCKNIIIITIIMALYCTPQIVNDKENK